jgi:hypothetical protein
LVISLKWSIPLSMTQEMYRAWRDKARYSTARQSRPLSALEYAEATAINGHSDCEKLSGSNDGYLISKPPSIDSFVSLLLGLNGRWVRSGSTSAMCRYADRGDFWPLNVSFLI